MRTQSPKLAIFLTASIMQLATVTAFALPEASFQVRQQQHETSKASGPQLVEVPAQESESEFSFESTSSDIQNQHYRGPDLADENPAQDAIDNFRDMHELLSLLNQIAGQYDPGMPAIPDFSGYAPVHNGDPTMEGCMADFAGCTSDAGADLADCLSTAALVGALNDPMAPALSAQMTQNCNRRHGRDTRRCERDKKRCIDSIPDPEEFINEFMDIDEIINEILDFQDIVNELTDMLLDLSDYMQNPIQSNQLPIQEYQQTLNNLTQ